MNSFDYIEVNAICIMVLSILLFGMPSRHQAEMTGKLYCKLLFTAIIVCLSDMIAGLCRGQMFSGARAALWISNILFFVSSLAESYIWLLYSAQVLNGRISVHYKRALGVTFAVISILYITAPLHGLTFFIDDQNCYHRGPLIWTHWLTLLVSMALPSLKALFSSTEKKRKKAIALFALLPFLCTVLQVAFYGFTVAQAGLTGSLLLLYMLLQSEEVNAALLRAQISEELSNTDALTKLNNRRAYDIRLQKIESEKWAGVVFIDLNGLKQMNDSQGHKAGDAMICRFSDLLRSCFHPEQIYRISGDQFVIITTERDTFPARSANLLKVIGKDASAGCAEGSGEDIVQLIKDAEKKMYDEKANYYISNGLDRRRHS